LVRAFVNLVGDDELSPIRGCRLETITVSDGGIQITDDPSRCETYDGILTRHDLDELMIEGESAPPGEKSSATMIVQAGRFIPYTAPSTGTLAHAGGYAAHFVEVYVESRPRNDPGRSRRLGHRWRQNSQPEDGPQSDHRRNRHGSRHFRYFFWWHKKELSFRIQKAPDEPTGGGPVHLNSLSGDPIHRAHSDY
jgi:hypothetical protein